MRTPTCLAIPAALLAASISGLVLIGPTSVADPAPKPSADPGTASCAALSKVQPAIDDLRDKANAYISNQAPPGGEEQKATPAPPAATTTPSAAAAPAQTTAKLQNIADSLRRISGELKGAEPAVADPPLRSSADKLATTVNEAAESVSQIATSQANSLNPLKLGSMGFNVTSAIVTYQANYNRVCGQNPVAPQTDPSTTASPAKPSASAPASSKAPASQAPKKPN